MLLQVMHLCICVTVSDSWGIGELNFNLTDTNPSYLHWHCFTKSQKNVINYKYIDDENEENVDKARKDHSS
jgi:hypothetical protein